MVSPFAHSPLSGTLGKRTASFYRLDPLGIVPIEFIGDLVPALTPNRVTFDMVDLETFSRTYTVTDAPLQDFTSATVNVHRNPDMLDLQGTLVSSIFGVFGAGPLRYDFLRTDNLFALSDRGEPIMVVTPRSSMPKATIESLVKTWDPDTGEATGIAITLKESRIVNPLTLLAVLPDIGASVTGNNVASPSGAQAATPVGAVASPPLFPGGAPSIGLLV